MPVATGVGAVYSVTPGDPQIGTNYAFSGQVQFNRGSYSPPQTSGDAFPAGNAINATMTDPFDGAAVSFTRVANTFDFSVSHSIPLTLTSYTVNGSVAHQAGGQALNNIGDVITSTLPSASASFPTLTLRSFALALRETVTINTDNSLSYGLAVESNPASKGSGLSSTQRVYGDTTQLVVTTTTCRPSSCSRPSSRGTRCSRSTTRSSAGKRSRQTRGPRRTSPSARLAFRIRASASQQ